MGQTAARVHTDTRSARARGTPEQRASYDFWIDNGLALVGSPETVIRKLKEQLLQ